MYKLTPTRPNVIDATTGQPMPQEGVTRQVLLPPDHYAQRTGDLTITEVKPAAPATTDAPANAAAELPAEKTTIKR
ncbi:MAG TPA: hypothetical protein VE934_12005 [Polaromonas sp.]|uniref:hypothetical protein n=1 Tax=Polaromonas sp. TaxID=1869339 RepID=UPI002D23E11A|nr:hypothetical protein [Polaromonas sp.]HYW57679.1 hypothetical protein [Polaromonas sp.]